MPTISVSPASQLVNVQLPIWFTVTGATLTPGVPGSPPIAVDHGSLANPIVLDATHAQAYFTSPATPQTVTFTIGAMTCTMAITGLSATATLALSPSSVAAGSTTSVAVTGPGDFTAGTPGTPALAAYQGDGDALLDDFSTPNVRGTIDGTQGMWSDYSRPDINADVYGFQDATSKSFKWHVGPSILKSGTSSGSNSPSVFNDTSADFTLLPTGVSLVGNNVNILTGTGSVGQGIIAGTNSATQLAVSGWTGATPDATSTYQINYFASYQVHFFPVGDADGYRWPNGYVRSNVKAGSVDVAAVNRMEILLRVDKATLANPNGGDCIQIGDYRRQHDNPTMDRFFAGQHYYNLFNLRFYANRFVKLIVTRKPQHRVSGNPNQEWPDDPTFATDPSLGLPDGVDGGGQVAVPTHWIDALTRWYIHQSNQTHAAPTQFYSANWEMARVTLRSAPSEPDSLVASVSVTYTGTAYELFWSGPKNVAKNYDVFYGNASLKAPDGTYNGTGTSGGTVSSTGDVFANVQWTSPSMAEAPIKFFAIRPAGQTLVFEAYLEQFATPPTAAAGALTGQVLSSTTAGSVSFHTASLARSPAYVVDPGNGAVGQMTIAAGMAPGTVSVGSLTSSSAVVTASGASGGTAPYHYQFQRAPDVAGSAGTFSNDGSSQLSTTIADAGLTPATTYWWRVVVTDSAGSPATATSPAVPGTTPGAPTLAASPGTVRVGFSGTITFTITGGTFP